ncbi:MAG: hypothetical protein ABI091_00385, partial [Ferruginibacter sp.]
YITPKQSKSFTFFYFGFTFYTISYVIYTTEVINLKFCQLLQAIGLVILVLSSLPLITFRVKNSYLKIVYSIYLCWLITILMRGFIFKYNFIKPMLFDPDNGMLLYFVPLIFLFPQKLSAYKKTFDVIIVLGVLMIVYDLVFFKRLIDRSKETQEFIEYSAKLLSLPCGFLLLTYKYHSRKRVILATGIMVFTLLFSIYKARRGLSLITLSILMAYFFLYLSHTKYKFLALYLLVFSILLGLFLSSNTYKLGKKGLFSFIAQRGEEDTRTGVEVYFYNDMQAKDWIIGKGINGQYYCPEIDLDQPTNYRNLIETGYLQIILKGGLIRLALYLFITIPAIFLGLFKSKNLLSRAAAIWILISLLSLYPATVNAFNLKYLLVWISVGICFTKNIRELPDNIVKDYFRNSYALNGNNVLQ